jgi:hypothetical protein
LWTLVINGPHIVGRGGSIVDTDIDIYRDRNKHTHRYKTQKHINTQKQRDNKRHTYRRKLELCFYRSKAPMCSYNCQGAQFCGTPMELQRSSSSTDTFSKLLKRDGRTDKVCRFMVIDFSPTGKMSVDLPRTSSSCLFPKYVRRTAKVRSEVVKKLYCSIILLPINK